MISNQENNAFFPPIKGVPVTDTLITVHHLTRCCLNASMQEPLRKKTHTTGWLWFSQRSLQINFDTGQPRSLLFFPLESSCFFAFQRQRQGVSGVDTPEVSG